MYRIIAEILFFELVLFSRIVNTLVFGGTMYETLSSRAHIEGRVDPIWARREAFINRLFFWEVDHCAGCWRWEVARARKVLIRNEDLKPH